MAPYLKHLPARWKWLLAYLLTMEAYAVAVMRHSRPDVRKQGAAGTNAHWYTLEADNHLWRLGETPWRGTGPAHLSSQRAGSARLSPEHKARTRGSPRVKAPGIAAPAKARYNDSFPDGVSCPRFELRTA